MVILNCPFCGGKGVVSSHKEGWQAFCDEILACPVSLWVGPFTTKKKAMIAWNTRKDGNSDSSNGSDPNE